MCVTDAPRLPEKNDNRSGAKIEPETKSMGSWFETCYMFNTRWEDLQKQESTVYNYVD